jgi:hypothetical protein
MGKKKAAFLLIGWGLIADSSSQITACSVGWWLMAGAGLF